MRHAVLSLALMTAGMTSAAQADSPITEAMADYLGACWANQQEGQYADEVYCFERMENHAVRVLRQNPGPHGMFYNESIWFWDAANEKVHTLMLTMNGHAIYADGAIEDGHFVQNGYRDGSGELFLRYHWGAVTGDQASLVRQQYLGEDYGGWNTEPERVFTRQPAERLETLREEMAFPDILAGGVTDVFEPLLNACWQTRLDDGRSDTHCYAPVFGRFVRDLHIVPGPPDYTGETIYHFDRENDEILFDYFNSIGGSSAGGGDAVENGIHFREEHYIAPDGTTRTFRSRMLNISPAGYISVTEEEIDGAWTEVMRQTFTRTEANPFNR
ncbi:hypothetical protein [Hyphobacterium sp.]|uniref:hypothetical protein n=1 Tax=Hyphobacterium sp. TaxID=2004662 RepID=UPI003BA8F863